MPLKRIPNPNSDANAWGTILNEHLAQTHRPLDGGLNKFDVFSQRPTNLTADDQGKTFLFTQTGNWHEWSGSSWKVLNATKLNVLDYGAIADGITDNTAIVQNIINANQGNQFSLYFPAATNTYVFNSKIIFNNVKPFSIVGDGAEVSKLEAKSNLIEVNGNIVHTAQQFKDQIKIEGLGMINKTSSYTATCLWLKNAQVYLNDLNINGKWGIAIDMLHCLYSDINRVNSFTWVDDISELSLALGNFKGKFLNAVASIANNVRSCQVAGYQYGFFFSKTQYDNHYCEGWSITDSSIYIVDYGIYAEHMTALNLSGCTFTPTGINCVKVEFGVGIHVVNSYLEGDNNATDPNSLLFTAIEFSPQTTSCSILGNQISGTGNNSKGYLVDGNNHSVSFNRFNFSNTSPTPFLANNIYGGGHTVFSNIGRGSNNTFSNGTYSQINMQGIKEYADNTAAVAATLKIGAIYRTGDILKIVH
jgi:Pectate lyase superfamily protein